MTTPGGSETFYGSIPVFRGFTKLMDPALYSPLPADWSIGVADIVESTKAIAEARYKAVNMAGAAGVAARAHGQGGREVPFLFGGAGAGVAVLSGGQRYPPGDDGAQAAWGQEDPGAHL